MQIARLTKYLIDLNDYFLYKAYKPIVTPFIS